MEGPRGHRGTRAIVRMVEYAPSSGGLALWAHHHDRAPGEPGAALTTDGTTLSYGEAFEALPVELQAGMVAHEVLHIALRHVPRYQELVQLLGDVDLALYNTCADAIVNSALDHLAWLKLPPRSVRLEGLLKAALDRDANAEAALLEWDVERLYRAIDDRGPTPSPGRPGEAGGRRGAGGGSEGAGGRSERERDDGAGQRSRRPDGPRAARVRALGAATADDLVPDAAAAASPEVEVELAREWSERLLRAHGNDGARSMLRALLADVPRSRTPWEQVLRTRLARALSPQPAPSWSRPSRSYIANQGRAGPNRRMPWEPGTSATRAVPRLAVVVDVSGSIEPALMERFAREIEALTRRLEATLVLVVGDDKVRRVAHFAPGRSDLRALRFGGGGGTDFGPLLEEADRHDPDIAVVLTDLEGPAGFRPRWPVIWAVPEDHAAAEPPFGRKLVLAP